MNGWYGNVRDGMVARVVERLRWASPRRVMFEFDLHYWARAPEE